MSAVKPLCIAEVDRFRLLRVIIKDLRKSIAKDPNETTKTEAQVLRRSTYLTQQDIADKAGVRQTTYNRVENVIAADERSRRLGERPRNPARRVSRDNFLSILIKGLSLAHVTIDALAWLYGEPPLSADEIDEYGVFTTEPPGSFNYDRLRKEVLRHLGNAYARHIEKNKPAKMTLTQIYSRDELILGEEALYDMESQPGMVRFAAQYPPHVFLSEAAVRNLHNHLSIDDTRQLIEIHRLRVSTLHKTLRDYGGKMIVCKPSVECLSRTQNIIHQKALSAVLYSVVSYMEEYKHFEVGLAPRTPALEMDIKSSTEVFIQGADGFSYTPRRTDSWGQRYIGSRDPHIVLGAVIEFERAWDDIEKIDRDRDAVQAWLRACSLHQLEQETEQTRAMIESL